MPCPDGLDHPAASGDSPIRYEPEHQWQQVVDDRRGDPRPKTGRTVSGRIRLARIITTSTSLNKNGLEHWSHTVDYKNGNYSQVIRYVIGFAPWPNEVGYG